MTISNSIQNLGCQIATECFGSHGNPAVVLIMGATASMLGWPDELCTALADHGLQVIRFDHRDTGQSRTLPPGEADYTVEDMAGDVLAVMDSYNLRQATLVGMSLGGYIAQMIAIQYPSRVHSLVLMSAEPLGWDGPPLPHMSDVVHQHFASLGSLDWNDEEAVTAFLLGIDRLCSGSGQPFDEQYGLARIKAVLARTTSPSSMFNHSSLSVREDWTGRFHEIDCPTLVLHGTEDCVLPVENGIAFAEHLTAAELVLIEGVGHEIPTVRISEIAQRIAHHISRTPG
jgi:pimeloyl-ACP methyl ester carboxylesterase